MLSKFSVKKPFTILVAVVIILVFGVISFIKMTPDLFPSINTPFVIVMTTYPGASPEEAEVEITEPMEQQLATLPNIKNVTSISGANYSIVSLEFTDDVNMDAISVDIRDKIDQIEGYLPEMAGTPLVMKINLDMVPVVTAAIGMEGKSVGEVSQFMKENLDVFDFFLTESDMERIKTLDMERSLFYSHTDPVTVEFFAKKAKE